MPIREKKSSLHRSKDVRKYLKGKEGKTEEIKRALGHRARLRKKYFKLLAKEGDELPEREAMNHEDKEIDVKKPLTYQQRMEINRERKKRRREEHLRRTKEKIAKVEKDERERKRKHKMFTKAKTRRGQPLMAPRINNLLDKIKKEVEADNKS